MASLFKDHDLARSRRRRAAAAVACRASSAPHPDDGEEIVAANGRYGPYLKWGDETRSLETEEQLFTVTLDEAVGILAQPKTSAAAGRRRRRRSRSSATTRCRASRSWSRTAASAPTSPTARQRQSLRKGDTVEDITHERAAELLQIRREAGPAKKARKGAKKAPAKKARQEGGGQEEGAGEEGRQEGRSARVRVGAASR